VLVLVMDNVCNWVLVLVMVKECGQQEALDQAIEKVWVQQEALVQAIENVWVQQEALAQVRTIG